MLALVACATLVLGRIKTTMPIHALPLRIAQLAGMLALPLVGIAAIVTSFADPSVIHILYALLLMPHTASTGFTLVNQVRTFFRRASLPPSYHELPGIYGGVSRAAAESLRLLSTWSLSQVLISWLLSLFQDDQKQPAPTQPGTPSDSPTAPSPSGTQTPTTPSNPLPGLPPGQYSTPPGAPPTQYPTVVPTALHTNSSSASAPLFANIATLTDNRGMKLHPVRRSGQGLWELAEELSGEGYGEANDLYRQLLQDAVKNHGFAAGSDDGNPYSNGLQGMRDLDAVNSRDVFTVYATRTPAAPIYSI